MMKLFFLIAAILGGVTARAQIPMTDHQIFAEFLQGERQIYGAQLASADPALLAKAVITKGLRLERSGGGQAWRLELSLPKARSTPKQWIEECGLAYEKIKNSVARNIEADARLARTEKIRIRMQAWAWIAEEFGRSFNEAHLRFYPPVVPAIPVVDLRE